MIVSPVRPSLGAVAVTLLLVTGCGGRSGPASRPAPVKMAGFPVTVTDCAGRRTVVDRPPARIVTSNAAGLELLFWLGAGNRVVGTGFAPGKGDMPARFADRAAKVRRLGGRGTGGAMQGISREELLSSGAKMYLEAFGAASGMAEPATPEQLARAGITKVVLRTTACPGTAQTDLSAVASDIRTVGAVVGARGRAERLIAAMNATTGRVRRAVAGVPEDRRPTLFFFGYDAGTAAPTVPCDRQVANAVLTLAGARNLFGDCHGAMKRVGWEEVVRRDPDWIQLGTRNHGGPRADRRAFEAAERFLRTFPATRGLTAVRRSRFIRIRSEVTTIAGVRNADTVRRIAAALYPGRVPAE